MEARELRIGNLLMGRNENVNFEVTLEDLQHVGDGSKCKPIPLTEEWLLKFGFLNFGNRWSNNQLSLDIIQSNGYYMANVTQEIKYVHQLQNLYFVLTYEELILT